jgi:hypothetical protein
MLATDQGDVLLELLHTRQQWREVLTSFGSLLSGPCRIFTRRGLDLPSLRRLLLDRRAGDAKLSRLGALLGEPPIGFLNQGPLMGERRPHATVMTNEE